MYSFVFAFVLVQIPSLSLQELPPSCCDSGRVLTVQNSSYACATSLEPSRIQIVNWQQKNVENFCTNIENNTVVVYKVVDSDYVQEKVLLDIDFYPKCCPLDHYYNTTTHGCVKSASKLETFFTSDVIEIGLPHCKIIEDVIIKSSRIGEFGRNVTRMEHYCVDRDYEGLYIARVCTEDYNICKSMKCVHKCCPDGQSFINRSKCHNTFVNGLDLTTLADNMEETNGSFAIVHGYLPPIYYLDKTRFDFYLQKDGTFVMNETSDASAKYIITNKYGVEDEAYCVEHALTAKLNNTAFFRVFPDAQMPVKFFYTRTAMCVSCFFLLLTILYYVVSKEKRTLFGKTLISYCVTNFCTYFLLSCLAFNLTFKGEFCKVSAFLGNYFILSCFTWMNAMCIDIYSTFGSPKSFSGLQNRSKELKRFMLFTLYGWGAPFLLTAICLTFYHLDVLPTYLAVVVNQKNCLILKGQGNYSQMIFTTLPVCVLELCNLILFVKTAVHCLNIKREINKMNDTNALKGEKKKRFNNFQDRFGLLIKLFLIMGISFLFEVISMVFDFKTNQTTIVIETIWDTFNCLQGLFIFLIFIVKRRVLKTCCNACGLTKITEFPTRCSSFQTQNNSGKLLETKRKSCG